MGTNYYARLKPNAELKEKLIEAIKNDKYDLVTSLSQQLYGSRGTYDDGNIIHLGKRSGGWKFLWNTNARTTVKLDENGNWDYISKIPVFLYPLTKEGIIKFLKDNNAVIVSEYYSDDGDNDPDDIMTVDEFIEMATNWCTDGLDSEKYQKEYNEKEYFSSSLAEFANVLGFDSPTSHDFYSDGLRFSTSTEFS